MTTVPAYRQMIAEALANPLAASLVGKAAVPWSQILEPDDADRTRAAVREGLAKYGRLDREAEVLASVYLCDGNVALAVDTPARDTAPSDPFSVATEWRWQVATVKTIVLLDDGLRLMFDENGPVTELNRRRLALADELRKQAQREEADRQRAARQAVAEREYMAKIHAWQSLPETVRAALSAAARFRSGTAGRAALVELARACTVHSSAPPQLDTELSGLVAEFTANRAR